jgi:type III pantothenate kinase
MTLLIDSGNTRIKLARLDTASGSLANIIALPYGQPDFEQCLFAYLSHIPMPKSCFWASVISNARSEKIQHILRAQGFSVNSVVAEKQALGVTNAYRQPARLGVDRFLAMIAAHHTIKNNALIVSVGTALTIDLLDNAGQHRGGVIAASEDFIHQAMAQQFPVFKDLQGRPSGFSDNTDDALSSGLRWLQLGAIEKALYEAKKTGMNDVSLLLCGGGAESLRSDLPEHLYRPHLVLEGLALWAQAHS